VGLILIGVLSLLAVQIRMGEAVMLADVQKYSVLTRYSENYDGQV
jgi:hypothetical protein